MASQTHTPPETCPKPPAMQALAAAAVLCLSLLGGALPEARADGIQCRHRDYLGSFDTPGYAQDVEVVGTRAFLADAYHGLHVLDVTDPASPTLLGQYDTPGAARSVTVAVIVRPTPLDAVREI